MDQRIKGSKENSGHRMQPDVFYALFANAVEFAPSFKGLQEGYISNDFEEAAALVVLKNDPANSRFTFSPYWSEALAHLAGFMVNGNPNKSPDVTFIVMGFESVKQTVAFEPGKEYMTYTRIVKWETDTAFCDAFVFDRQSSKMVMQVIGLRYQRLPRTTWRHILSGAHAKTKSGAPVRAASQSVSKEITGESMRFSTSADNGQTKQEDARSQEEEAPASGEFDLILDSISKSTGSDRAEFTDDTEIAELGVDSIMAIEIVASVKTESDLDLPASFVFEYPTIGDLRRAFGGKPKPTIKDSPGAKSNSTSSSEGGSRPRSPTPAPESISSLGSSVVRVEEEIVTPANKEQDTSPAPTVRITLLQGRTKTERTPLYLMADGTGSIATYIHLPVFKSKMPVYGIDSPFIRCPSRLTRQVGIEGVAKLIVDAMIKAQPKGSFFVGGFSAGCMVAYEVSKQLAVKEEAKTGVAVFGAAVAQDGLWSSSSAQEDHLRAYFVAMRLYNPRPMTTSERPGRTSVIWAKKGLVGRIASNPKLMKMLADEGIPTEAYPGYMEDPRLSPMACLVPDKTPNDLGPNGWDNQDKIIVAQLNFPVTESVHICCHKGWPKGFVSWYSTCHLPVNNAGNIQLIINER
ncbi:putative Conidial yellow pigment biosynthesis polyketide synthase [Glarea lozoyensis 74030]|uniref:Putative Conidial yellow pigment biosynthesis polyketide synthase n=1 Tax=Glarea lozoyensis (strain ATCC 74030 / MF5533) TaxID=1104152 RepID=H0EXY0_GLAL7|nr:putative Conidial yellow pigment biosynthesis polyketide synthase [Glarea lozoyensis 74030]